LTLSSGWAITEIQGRGEYKERASNILKMVEMGTAAINSERVRNLTAMPEDINNLDYMRL
ncbi:MAG: hypothetical protein NT118_17395, partial [Lentisphaerae bacterium]|nr:hypothetical protein [Lentisphaerota bacterium]